MALYLISYSIAGEDEFDYEPFMAWLEDREALNILSSVWLMNNETHKEKDIFGGLQPLIQKKDSLFVVEVQLRAVPYWNKLLIDDDDFQKFLESARPR